MFLSLGPGGKYGGTLYLYMDGDVYMYFSLNKAIYLSIYLSIVKVTTNLSLLRCNFHPIVRKFDKLF